MENSNVDATTRVSDTMTTNMSPVGTARRIDSLSGSSYKFMATLENGQVRLAAMDMSPDAIDQAPFYIDTPTLFKDKREAFAFVNSNKSGQSWDTPGKLIPLD